MGEGEEPGEDGAGSPGAPGPGAPDHDAITSIIAKVAAREIPRDAGVQLLQAHVGERAELVMGEAGKSFFTAAEPGHAAEMDSIRAENAALKRSQSSTKTMLARVLEKNRAGELVVNPIGAGGEDIEPGDVVEVAEEPAEGEGAPAEMASPPKDAVGSGT